MIVSFVDKDVVQKHISSCFYMQTYQIQTPRENPLRHCTLYCLALHFVTFHKKGCRKGPCNDIILGIWTLYRLLVTHNWLIMTILLHPLSFFFVILLVGIIDQRRQFLVASGWPNQCKNSGPPKKEKSEIPWGFWWVCCQGNYQASGSVVHNPLVLRPSFGWGGWSHKLHRHH